MRWILAPVGTIAVFGALVASGNWISNRAEERGRTSARIESANESIDNLRGTVETQRKTVSELAVAVADVRATVQNLRDTVETQHETVSELAEAVVNVRATAEGVRDAVESIEGTVDALDETIPLLVSCVIDLNRTQGIVLGYAIAVGDREIQDDNRPAIQLPDPPESCEQARNRARR